MNTYGAIDLRDYETVLRGQRRKRWTRIIGFLGIVGICILCAAAGSYFRPWTGRSKDLGSFEEAVAMMRNTPAADTSAVNAGMGVSTRAIAEAVDVLREIAKRDNQSGVFAPVYMKNLARRCLNHLLEIEAAAQGRNAEMATKGIDELEELLKESRAQRREKGR